MSSAPATRSPPQSTPSLPGSGDLSQLSSLRLYCLAARGLHTGLLSFKLSDRVISVNFRKGQPELLDSNHPEDSVGDFFLQQKLLTPEQLATAKQASASSGDVLAGLFTLRLLNPSSAFEAITQRAASVLARAFAASTGSFTFQADQLPRQHTMPLGNPWSLMTEAVRRISSADLRRRLQVVLDLPMTKSGVREATADLRLNPQEMRVLNRLDETRTLHQIAHEFPQEADILMRVVFLLKEIGALTFAYVAVAEKPASVPKANSELAKRPEKVKDQPTSPPAKAPPVEMSVAQLRERVERLKSETLFQVLGVTEKSDAKTIKAAYFKWAKVYHPDTVPPEAPPEVAKLKSEIFAALGDAYRRLSDENSRALYMDELKGGAQKLDLTQILAAEELFNKACVQVKSKKFTEAVKTLEEAIKANPEEGEFYAWRGYAKFFALRDTPQGTTEAHRDLQTALSKNERCAPAYYFLGQMSKLRGEKTDALRHFKRALELRPDDIDAQREVRFLSKA